MKQSLTAVAVLAPLAFAGTTFGQPLGPDAATEAPSFAPATAPATPATAPPPAPLPTAPSPANQLPYAFPPGYGYPPPGYAYPPPGYGYPPPGYAYPPPGYATPPGDAYPPGYAPYPQGSPGYYPAPSVAQRPTSLPAPKGKLRLGASLGVFAGGRLRYQLLFRDEALVSHSAPAAMTPALMVFADYQLTRLFYLGLSVQYVATVKWSQSATLDPSSSTSSHPYGGSGAGIDLLPRLGISYPLMPWLRITASAAPGYSFINASDMIEVYVNPGTMAGFTVQGDAGVLVSFSEHAFAQGRLSYQSSFVDSRTTSSTTGETATAELRASYLGVHAGIGYWF